MFVLGCYLWTVSIDFLPQNVNLQGKNVKKTNLEFLKLCYRTLQIKQKVRIETFEEIHLSNGMEVLNVRCYLIHAVSVQFKELTVLKELFELMTGIDLLKAER